GRSLQNLGGTILGVQRCRVIALEFFLPVPRLCIQRSDPLCSRRGDALREDGGRDLRGRPWRLSALQISAPATPAEGASSGPDQSEGAQATDGRWQAAVGSVSAR